MLIKGRSESQINAAKRGQIIRLGGPDLPRLKRKKCKMGKSCGASCIPSVHVCMVDIPWALNPGITKVANQIKAQANVPIKAPAAKKKLAQAPVTKEVAAKGPAPASQIKPRKNAKEAYDKVHRIITDAMKVSIAQGDKKKYELQRQYLLDGHKKLTDMGVNLGPFKVPEWKAGGTAPVKQLRAKAATPAVNLPPKAKEVYDIIDSPGFKLQDVKGSRAASSINWNAVADQSANQMGKGMFGAFYRVPDTALAKGAVATKHPNGVGIKAGEVGHHEIEALKIAGNASIGPKLIAAQHGEFKSKKVGGSSSTYIAATGRIAMGIVPGEQLYKAPKIVNGIETRDAYWIARAKIHRLGIAHNDTHAGNTLVDSKGVARFVDFGLAQVSPKAALAEALGGASRSGADFQAERNLMANGGGKVFRKVSSNMRKVEEAMVADGLSSSTISRLKYTNIRQKDDFFSNDGAWSKISDEQAKKYIDLLYKGV